jgi:hypothetical protein
MKMYHRAGAEGVSDWEEYGGHRTLHITTLHA